MLERLRQEMARHDINARELSIRANIGRSFVYDLLSGRSPNPTTKKLTSIAEALGVSLQYLISGPSSHGDYIDVPLLTNSLQNNDDNVTCKSYLLNKKWIATNLKTAPENLRMVIINSDAMSPTINNNDAVIIDISSKVPVKSGMFILQNNANMIARRMEFVLGKLPKQVFISPDNNKYVPYSCNIDEINVLGRIIWLAREVE